MARLYLVRHGRASASWDADLDPGLDALGRQQAEAVAERLAPVGPIDLVTSPMRRARETAIPLARLWHREPRVESAIAEIPSPCTDLAERGRWLRAAMEGVWSDLPPDYRAWRDGVPGALMRLESDAVLFTHYIAINAAVGAATGDDRMVCFRPDNCSVTILETFEGGLRVIRMGHEADTVVG